MTKLKHMLEAPLSSTGIPNKPEIAQSIRLTQPISAEMEAMSDVMRQKLATDVQKNEIDRSQLAKLLRKVRANKSVLLDLETKLRKLKFRSESTVSSAPDRIAGLERQYESMVWQIEQQTRHCDELQLKIEDADSQNDKLSLLLRDFTEAPAVRAGSGRKTTSHPAFGVPKLRVIAGGKTRKTLRPVH